MIVRDATVDDVVVIVALAERMHKHSGYRDFNFSRDKFFRLLNYMLQEPRHDDFVFVCEQDGEIIGGFMGEISTHFFGDDKVSYDLGLFVKPEHRGARVASLLIAEYINRAKNAGVVDITIANSIGGDYKKVGELFTTMGFTQVGGVFKMKGDVG